MDNLTVTDIINQLGISKSYLYKIIKRENINVPKSETGRYFWSEKIVEDIKQTLENKELKISKEESLISKLKLKQSFINNRRYLGNKYSLSDFIKTTVDNNCGQINIVADVFSGTGSVSHVFKDKMLLTNDILYSNYLSNYCWFKSEEYASEKIIYFIYEYNKLKTSENNYMREKFADTFFSADDCSKIGYIREDIEKKYRQNELNFKEYSILITSLLYGMDKIANTVGHYDAFRKGVVFDKKLELPVILPDKNLNENNKCFNKDANILVKNIECDLLYLDPPYNSRQYSDAYHLLENVARWEKPEVYGVARKMDRSSLKSKYCLNTATEAFEDLIKNCKAKYILLSYNNMKNKGNDRSNAKIYDEEIFRILMKKGKVTVFEEDYKTFTTGKSNIENNKERLFLCKVYSKNEKKPLIRCPFNYIGGKHKILNQIMPLFKETSIFLDLFSGGANVAINSNASKIILNDSNVELINLMQYIKDTNTKKLLETFDRLIKKYGLSDTSLYGYEFYGCNSSNGLAEYNRESYLKLRNDYNKLKLVGKEDFSLLYLLIVYSFNNQIRFNAKGEFNLPVGKRDFNSKMKSKLILFSEELKKKDTSLISKDFREIKIKDLNRDTFIYCDPPYLITTATYNENGNWTNEDEKDLLELLDNANKNGFSFALSNVLESKGKRNDILYNWIEKNKYNCHFIKKSYNNSNYQRKDKSSKTIEVLITNY